MIFLADGRIVDEMRDPTAEAVLDRIKRLDVTTAEIVAGEHESVEVN